MYIKSLEWQKKPKLIGTHEKDVYCYYSENTNFYYRIENKEGTNEAVVNIYDEIRRKPLDEFKTDSVDNAKAYCENHHQEAYKKILEMLNNWVVNEDKEKGK